MMKNALNLCVLHDPINIHKGRQDLAQVHIYRANW